ncbi:MAG: cyclic lactone autoinducer peptide [Bacillota bacterium]
MKNKVILMLGTVLFWLAQVNITNACNWGHYEPKLPEHLR